MVKDSTILSPSFRVSISISQADNSWGLGQSHSSDPRHSYGLRQCSGMDIQFRWQEKAGFLSSKASEQAGLLRWLLTVHWGRQQTSRASLPDGPTSSECCSSGDRFELPGTCLLPASLAGRCSLFWPHCHGAGNCWLCYSIIPKLSFSLSLCVSTAELQRSP